jgi:hypothetical protein
MEFLDPKERVIDLKLTPYGRYLLSTGKFKPAMYAFYDDDVIYDYEFAGIANELQNEIEPRIQETTPKLATQVSFRSAEIGVFSNSPNMVEDLMPGVLADKANKIKIQDSPTTEYVLQNPLGTSAFNSNMMPAWNVNFLKAELSSSAYALTGSKVPTTIIPQLECDIKYVLSKFGPNPEDEELGVSKKLAREVEDSEIYDNEIVFEDGSRLEYEEDFVFLQVEEANTEFLKDNFTVEVFEVVEISGDTSYGNATKTALKKLYFDNGSLEPDTDNVDFYFEMTMDNENDPDEYCKLVKGLNKVKNVFLDDTFLCPERIFTDESVAVDIYNTGENADEDPC